MLQCNSPSKKHYVFEARSIFLYSLPKYLCQCCSLAMSSYIILTDNVGPGYMQRSLLVVGFPPALLHCSARGMVLLHWILFLQALHIHTVHDMYMQRLQREDPVGQCCYRATCPGARDGGGKKEI